MMVAFVAIAVVAVFCALFGGYILGHAGSNAVIRDYLEIITDLRAERDSLQTRYMALLNKEAGK